MGKLDKLVNAEKGGVDSFKTSSNGLVSPADEKEKTFHDINIFRNVLDSKGAMRIRTPGNMSNNVSFIF
jgi:hypothetical protein